jgi:adenylate cyclase
VTVLFADLSGSTTLGERLDPEELRRILALFFSALAREIQRYGGTVDKYIGDAIMAVFGAPVAHEDDAERAISAAVAMQRAIGRLNDDLDLEQQPGMRLALRIGINTGEVVAGLLAGDVQGAYTVVGDTVNTAQRFESAAPLGGILVSDSTRRLAEHAFTFDEIPALVFKGKSEPQPAFRVQGRRADELEVPRTPLVGRADELVRLLSALDASVSGLGERVHIQGDAGIGKSRLVREFRAGLTPQIIQVVGRCASFEVDTPYALVSRLLRHAFGITSGEDEAAARVAIERTFAAIDETPDNLETLLLIDVLGYGERRTFDPESKQRVLLNVVRRLLVGNVEQAPLLVVAEDVHWIDTASCAVLAALAREAPTWRCMLLTTARTGWAAPWPTDILQLEALDARGAQAVVEAAFGSSVDQALAETILTRTGGNPFFIEEVVRGMRDSGDLFDRDGRLSLRAGSAPRLPATIQEVVAAHLDRLLPANRHVLQNAAVCGRIFWEPVLARLVSEEGLADSLTKLEHEGLILPQGILEQQTRTFRHALFQEVAYQSQLQSQRRVTHAAIGEALEILYPERLDELINELAFHYGRSDNDAKALHWLVRAGDRARRLFANQEALRHYAAVLNRSAHDSNARAVAHEGIGDIQRLAGNYSEAMASYDQALAARSPLDVVARSHVHRKIGVVHQLLGATQLALQSFDNALADLPPEAARERALALNELSQVRWHQGRYDEAIQSLTEAVEHAERAGADDARADAYKQLGTVHVLKGDTAQGLHYYDYCRQLYEALGDLFGQANAYSNIGVVHRRAGRYEDALAAHARALEIRTRIDDPRGIADSRNNRAQVHSTRGDLEQAELDYAAALNLWDSIGYAHGVAIARTGLGITLVQKGDVVAGRNHLVLALAEWEQLGSRTYVSETQRYLAQAYQPADLDTALVWADRAVTSARELRARDQEGMALQVLGAIRLARGELSEAVAVLESSRDLLRETSERKELARTLAALGRVYARLPPADARRAQAPVLVTEARTILRDLGAGRDLSLLEEAIGVETY